MHASETHKVKTASNGRKREQKSSNETSISGQNSKERPEVTEDDIDDDVSEISILLEWICDPKNMRSIALLIFPLINFILWYLYGRYRSNAEFNSTCTKNNIFHKVRYTSETNKHSTGIDCSMQCSPPIDSLQDTLRIRPLLTKGLINYKADSLINIRYPEWSLLLQPKQQHKDKSKSHSQPCHTFVNPHASTKRKFSCLAVVRVKGLDASFNLLRFEMEFIEPNIMSGTKNVSVFKDNSIGLNSTGFFANVANENGRKKLADKMLKLFQNLPDLESLVVSKLSERGIHKGGSVVVMVVNSGEIDLFANFACSCRESGVAMTNMLVFCGSADIVPLVEAMGALAIYHEPSFAYVSKMANYEYLDNVFVDMMWFKSFSVWLLLKLGYNTLFQDVDLVWFKNPLDLFLNVGVQPGQSNQKNMLIDERLLAQIQSNDDVAYLDEGESTSRLRFTHPKEVDAFLSDDGQRSLRYTPFYANSGFYFLFANNRTEYFAWTIMTSFALLHITGSHQNIFTIRLIEGLDLSQLRPKLLTLRQFPSGVKYNHDKPFMRGILDRHEEPYLFHMCWTRNKTGKLENFRLSHMWYLNDYATEQLESFYLGEEQHRSILKEVVYSGGGSSKKSKTKKTLNSWDYVGNKICREIV